jgi:hypothetical protein
MANKKTPNINLRGIRARIPQGYLVGRSDSGDGRLQLIGPRELQTLLNTMGIGAAQNPGAPPTINFFAQGLLLNNEYLGQLNFTKSVLFQAGLPTGQGSCLTAPADANQSLSLRKNGVEWATVDYAQTTGTTATFTCAADTQFDAGDVLTLWAPTPADSAWADISFSFTGIAL